MNHLLYTPDPWENSHPYECKECGEPIRSEGYCSDRCYYNTDDC